MNQHSVQPLSPLESQSRKFRIGSVSFLNAKPLIYGLESAAGIRLSLDVPSRLLDGMRAGLYDVALLPVIDYQQMPGLRILTSGGIGCDGPTLTVRIFSPIPIREIRHLACDPDSHTSVALARLILAERYGLRPEFAPLKSTAGLAGPSTAVLLIGDKVVCEEPAGLPHQLDLGEEWKRLTGLPFVFAAWMARADVNLGELPTRLEQSKREGLANIERIIERDAVPRGWPREAARRYLTEYLRFDVGENELRAVRLFHEMAGRHGLVPEPVRPLVCA